MSARPARPLAPSPSPAPSASAPSHERQTNPHPTTFLPPSPRRSPSLAAHSQPAGRASPSAPHKPHGAPLELDERSYASQPSSRPPSPPERAHMPLFESMSSVYERWQAGTRVRQVAGAGSLWGDESETEDEGGEQDAAGSALADDAGYMEFVGVGGWSDDEEVEAKVGAEDRSRAAVAWSGPVLVEAGPALSGSANGNSAVAALELFPDNPSNASIRQLSPHDNEATSFVSPFRTPPTTPTLELAPRGPSFRRRSRDEFESPATATAADPRDARRRRTLSPARVLQRTKSSP